MSRPRIHVASVAQCRAARRAIRGAGKASAETLQAVGPGSMWTTLAAPDLSRGEALDGQVLEVAPPGAMRSRDGRIVEAGDTLGHAGPAGEAGYRLRALLEAQGWEVTQ